MDEIRCSSAITMSQSYHEPVLVSEVVDALQVKPGKRYIDGTYGGGGHTRAIRALGGIVLGIDVDPDAGAVLGNFRNIERIAKEQGFGMVDGILFDLGVSSHQLDTPKRGFSYRFADAPLDLRMSQETGETAAELVNRMSEQELYEIFTRFGEEERARTIAHDIVRARSIKPIQTTGDMIAVVSSGPAVLSRIFQALRIVVNDEFGALQEGIEGAYQLLAPGGRLAIISFHSLEDRIVKRKMGDGHWRLVNKKPIVARWNEIQKNKRARSAKLRVVEKL